jgi:hypothetical protein
MADYYPLISRAVGELGVSTGEARKALYRRARSVLVAQLHAIEPALSESNKIRERLALEDAITFDCAIFCFVLCCEYDCVFQSARYFVWCAGLAAKRTHTLFHGWMAAMFLFSCCSCHY